MNNALWWLPLLHTYKTFSLYKDLIFKLILFHVLSCTSEALLVYQKDWWFFCLLESSDFKTEYIRPILQIIHVENKMPKEMLRISPSNVTCLCFKYSWSSVKDLPPVILRNSSVLLLLPPRGCRQLDCVAHLLTLPHGFIW